MNRSQLLKYAADLERSVKEISLTASGVGVQLTYEEAAAEVAAFCIGTLYGKVRAMAPNDRFLMNAWEYASKEVDSKLNAFAKNQGYNRRRVTGVIVQVEPIKMLSETRIWNASIKAVERFKINSSSIAPTLLTIHAGQELRKFTKTLSPPFSFIDAQLRNAVSTSLSGQGFRTTNDPAEIAKLEKMAEAFAKGIAVRSKKAAIYLSNQSL